MKDPKKKRDVRIEFVVSEQEAELIQEHMAELWHYESFRLPA